MQKKTIRLKNNEVAVAFVDEIAKENRFAKKDVALIIKKYHEKIRDKCESLENGYSFTLTGFLKFDAQNRAPRIARNPKTKEEFPIPFAKNIKVKVTRAFHDYVNGIASEDGDE